MSDVLPHYVDSELIDDLVVFCVLVSKIRDSETSYGLRDEMIAQLTATPTQKVIIDLATVDFIGSVGFLAFLNTRRHLADGRIVFCNISPNILEAFRLCRLVSSDEQTPGPFEVQPTRAAAIASLSG